MLQTLGIFGGNLFQASLPLLWLATTIGLTVVSLRASFRLLLRLCDGKNPKYFVFTQARERRFRTIGVLLGISFIATSIAVGYFAGWQIWIWVAAVPLFMAACLTVGLAFLSYLAERDERKAAKLP